jgi:hypothetical protein
VIPPTAHKATAAGSMLGRPPTVVRSPRSSPSIISAEPSPRGAEKYRQVPGSDGTVRAGSVVECAQPGKIRGGPELDSEPMGFTQPGELVTVLNIRVNEYDQLRVRFDRGWSSAKAGDGTELLRPVTLRAGDRFRVAATCIYRAGCEMNTAEIGILDADETITALAIGHTAQGKLRIRFDRGWASTAGSNGPLLVRVDASSTLRAHLSTAPVLVQAHDTSA